MKKLVLSLIILASVNIVAQPILTNSNFVFNYPDSVSYFVADSNTVIDNTIGANVIFKYDTLKGYGVLQKGYYVDPATTPGTSSFPSANLAEKSDASAQNYVYTLNSIDSVTNLGFVADVVGFGLTTAKYNIDPEVTMKFPFTYNNAYTDNYAGSFSANVAIVGLVTTNAAGSVTIEADAWGRLDLPYTLSIDSVIRVKRVESMVTDAIVMTPLPTIPPITVNLTVISYYKPSISNAPLLSFVDGSYTQNGSIIQSSRTRVSKFPIGFVSVEEANVFSSVELYPNPAKNSATLMIETEKPAHLSIELLNTLGQNVMQITNTKTNVGKNKFSIDTSKIPSGIYFVTINIDGKMTSSRKLVVE